MIKKLLAVISILLLFGCSGLQLVKSGDYVTRPEVIVLLQKYGNKPMSLSELEKMMEGSGSEARAFTDYEGTGTGALGAVACASLTTGDQAWVQTSTPETAFYYFDSTDATAEDDTDKANINCNEVASPPWSAGNWMLSTIRSAGSTSPGVASPKISFIDSDGSDSADQVACYLYANMWNPTSPEDSDFWIECKQGGADVQILFWDESDNRWESTKTVAITGDLRGGGFVYEVTDPDYTLGTAPYDSYGTLFINGDNDAVDFTLESAAAGMMACFAQEQGVTAEITVQPNTGNYLVVDGVRGTAATDYACTGANCKICVWAQDSTDWIVFEKGPWSE